MGDPLADASDRCQAVEAPAPYDDEVSVRAFLYEGIQWRSVIEVRVRGMLADRIERKLLAAGCGDDAQSRVRPARDLPRDRERCSGGVREPSKPATIERGNSSGSPHDRAISTEHGAPWST